MKALYPLLLALLIAGNVRAQFFDASNYDWEQAVYDLVEVDDSTDSYYLYEKYLYNYYFDEEDKFALEKLFHLKVHLNSDDAVEGFNRIYVAQSADLGGLRKFKARVISPDGSIREVGEDDILTGTDEESGDEYSYVALEGLELESQIEYFYIKRIGLSYKGIQVGLEGYAPTRRFELDVISPGHLVFEGKVYNSDSIQFERDTTLEEQNRIYVHANDIPRVPSEVNAFRDVNLAGAIFKLDRNLYNGQSDISSYSHTTQEIIDAVNREYERSEEKALAKIVKKIDDYRESAEGSQARIIEDYLKDNYHFIAVSNPELGNLASIRSNKAFNYYGALRLYSSLFRHYEIPFQLVYTCNRADHILDEDFHSSIFLDDLLFYLPEEDDYLDYSSVIYRLGMISPLNRGNYGLFMEEVDLGDQVVGLGTVKYIEPTPASFTVDSLIVQVQFSPDLYDNELAIRRVLTGYKAFDYQPVLDLIPDEEDRRKFRETLLTYVNEEAEVKEMELEYASARDMGKHPLVAEGVLSEANFVEKAGPNYLFKLGTLIGPQLEMYQENEERNMPIQSRATKTYQRIIRFDIPDGYRVSGLESLAMDEQLMYEGEISARFISRYERDGNSIEVEITEYYNEVEYPKELFDDFKKVINAAADFNKKTLLFERES